MGVAAGSLDRRIRLQRRNTARNRSGTESREPEDVGTVWAQKIPVSGREPFAAQQRYALVDTRFVIRYRSDIGPIDRVLDGEQVYDVQGVLALPGGRPDRLEILATALVQ